VQAKEARAKASGEVKRGQGTCFEVELARGERRVEAPVSRFQPKKLPDAAYCCKPPRPGRFPGGVPDDPQSPPSFFALFFIRFPFTARQRARRGSKAV